MEENEIQLELNSFLALLIMTSSSSLTISSLCSDPLFSCIITLYTLILIFYPYALKFFISPVLILTSFLLLFILRLGAGHQGVQTPAKTELNATGVRAGSKKIRENRVYRDTHFDSNENSQSLPQIDKWVDKTELIVTGEDAGNNKIRENRDTRFDSNENFQYFPEIDKWVEKTELNVTGEDAGNKKIRENGENRDAHFDSNEKSQSLNQIDKWVESQIELGFEICPVNKKLEDSFIEWNVRAPLEVIYEAYEGEEDDQDYEVSRGYQIKSLSMYYPETDSDSSSDDGFPVTGGWDSPESVYLQWEEEDREGMLIEIALDNDGKRPPGTGFHFEEDNLIEIDISPCGYDSV